MQRTLIIGLTLIVTTVLSILGTFTYLNSSNDESSVGVIEIGKSDNVEVLDSYESKEEDQNNILISKTHKYFGGRIGIVEPPVSELNEESASDKSIEIEIKNDLKALRVKLKKLSSKSQNKKQLLKEITAKKRAIRDEEIAQEKLDGKFN